VSEDYTAIADVDIAIGRGALRLAQYRLKGETVAALVQAHVIDRLLDRRLELMRDRDEAAA
jgi:hypothetical protein